MAGAACGTRALWGLLHVVFLIGLGCGNKIGGVSVHHGTLEQLTILQYGQITSLGQSRQLLITRGLSIPATMLRHPHRRALQFDVVWNVRAVAVLPQEVAACQHG